MDNKDGNNRKLDLFSSAEDESYKLNGRTLYQIKIFLQKQNWRQSAPRSS